jgi:heme O synthase-like polyprenyltransferase
MFHFSLLYLFLIFAVLLADHAIAMSVGGGAR